MSIQDEAAKLDIVAGLERALDRTFQRLRDNARREWENHFPKGEPSDACATVHVSTVADEQLIPARCAGMLERPRPQRRAKLRPRLA